MAQILLIFLTALMFSVLSTPIVRRLALQTGVVDAPNARKFTHDPCRCSVGRRSMLGLLSRC